MTLRFAKHLMPFAISTMLCLPLCDGTTTFYGPQGQFEGFASTYDGQSTFYGPQGQFGGFASSPSGPNGPTTFYGPQGSYEGFLTGE